MGQVSHGPAVGRPSFLEVDRGDEQGGDEAGGDQEKTHDQGGGREQATGVADAEVEIIALDQRHDRDAGFETGQAEGETGKEQA